MPLLFFRVAGELYGRNGIGNAGFPFMETEAVWPRRR